MKIMVKQDLRGLRFGRLTVVEEAARRNKKHRYWLCLCDCGRETIVESSHLRSGHTKSCGCYRMELPREQRRKPMKTPPDAGRQEELRLLRRIATGKTYVNNTSGQRGVYRKGKDKWRASIGFQGKVYHLGTFARYEEAVEARQEAEKRLYEAFLGE